MDRGAWWAAVHGVSKSWTRLSGFTFTFHFHAVEKEMATHSSALAWKIAWTEEPGRLQSIVLHRVGHYWSDLAAAAAAAVAGPLMYRVSHGLDSADCTLRVQFSSFPFYFLQMSNRTQWCDDIQVQSLWQGPKWLCSFFTSVKVYVRIWSFALPYLTSQ